jgi:hypothetical protein
MHAKHRARPTLATRARIAAGYLASHLPTRRHVAAFTGTVLLVGTVPIAGPATYTFAALPDSDVAVATQTLTVTGTQTFTVARGTVTIQVIPARATNDIQAAARRMLARTGLDAGEWTCLYDLWNRESRWNPTAQNTSSGAYGIPQALPGKKMATVAADWQTNPVTQIAWGLSYITGRYATPCHAWAHSNATGWY